MDKCLGKHNLLKVKKEKIWKSEESDTFSVSVTSFLSVVISFI